MRKLFINVLVFGGPLIICLMFFLIDDPFGILFNNKCLAEPSEDVTATRQYLKEFKTKNYTSFIFGNSRTHAFRDKDWQNYIGKEQVFHFGCPGECLLNIEKKLELILNKQKIKNVLILIDSGLIENTDNEKPFYQGPVYNHTPLTSNISHFKFYANYIGYYFSNYFFAKHIYFKLTHNYKEEWMKDAFKEPASEVKSVQIINYPSLADSILETDFNKYKRDFNPDYKTYANKVTTLSIRDLEHLIKIKKILTDNKINYKIIYPPDFSKRKINTSLDKTLRNLFSTNFYDFSGINKITTDSTMNYENLHFTYRAGQIMLDSMHVN